MSERPRISKAELALLLFVVLVVAFLFWSRNVIVRAFLV